MKIFSKSAAPAVPNCKPVCGKLLSAADINAVAGGLNPQPLPPRIAFPDSLAQVAKVGTVLVF